MAKPDFVFDLVHSLSKSEKRHFKLFSSRYKHEGEKKYLGIFRALEKQRNPVAPPCDENAGGTLARDRHYLSEMLMASLRQFHAETSIQAQLGNELISIELLRNKGLYQHALRRLLRLKREAARYELPELMLQVISLECEIRSSAAIEWPALAASLFDETETWLSHLQHLNRLSRLRVDELQQVLDKGRPQTEDERREWNKRIAAFDPSVSLTGLVSERSQRLRAQAYACFVIADFHPANESNRLRYELIAQHPELMEKAPLDYVFLLFFYASTSIQVSDYETAGRLLGELRALRGKYSEGVYSALVKNIDERLLPLELFLFGKSGDHDRIRERAPEVETFIRSHPNRQSAVIGFNIAVAFMFSDEYKKVIHWTHLALSRPEIKRDYLLFFGNHILQVLAHIGLNDFDVAESLALSAKRFVSQRKNAPRSVDIHIANLLVRCASTDKREAHAQYANEFLALFRNDPGYLNTEEYFMLRHWLEKTALNNK